MVNGLILDLSDNNPHPVNFTMLRNHGVIGVVLKATEGTGYVNPDYDRDRIDALAAGLPVIAYHFYDPAADPVEQAKHFLDVADPFFARALDIETGTDGAPYLAFLDTLKRGQSERLIYGSLNYLGHAALPAWKWVADYGVNTGQPTPSVRQACKAIGAQMWQYTSEAHVLGVSARVDASLWLGSPGTFAGVFQHFPKVPLRAKPKTALHPLIHKQGKIVSKAKAK